MHAGGRCSLTALHIITLVRCRAASRLEGRWHAAHQLDDVHQLQRRPASGCRCEKSTCSVRNHGKYVTLQCAMMELTSLSLRSAA